MTRILGHMGSRLRGTDSPPVDGPCGTMFCAGDLTFLLHAAADRLGASLDKAAREIGLSDVRDWFVLGSLADGQQRTQLELSRVVCVDKTTLISLLDRLEGRGLVIRTTHPGDRRVRIPQITDAGRDVLSKFATARDEAQEEALRGLDGAQRALLLDTLLRIADIAPAPVS